MYLAIDKPNSLLLQNLTVKPLLNMAHSTALRGPAPFIDLTISKHKQTFI